MSVEEPATGESFSFRVRKSVIAMPSVKWYNTYEARFLNPGTSENLESLAVGLATFESKLLLTPYKVEAVLVSTWEADSHPYNPMSFVSFELPITGQRALGGSGPADLRVALFLKRTVESGRIGRLFLRGSLRLSDLSNLGGEFSLLDPAAIETEVDDALSDGALFANFEGGAANPTLALIGAGEVTRPIMDITTGGVSFIKLNHKYFDRA